MQINIKVIFLNKNIIYFHQNKKKKFSDENFGIIENKWHWVMGEMIFAFEAIATGLDQDFANPDIDAIGKRVENGLRLFGKYYQGLWD